MIIEPTDSGRAIDPGDVHMATAQFSDPDPGDSHACSDWEIRSGDGTALIWSSPCATGVLAVHIHLGDGTFQNPEGHLIGLTRYQVFVRFRDSSGDPSTEWSEWASRPFTTSPASTVSPMQIVDVLSSPPPRLYDPANSDGALPGGASIAMVSERGELLLSFTGSGAGNQAMNPPPLSTHAFVKVLMSAGATDRVFPAMDIDFADEAGARRTIYLPSLAIAHDGTISFWIAQDGSSFYSAGEETPVFRSVAQSADSPWRMFEPGYRIERVASGLQLPVNIAFVPVSLPDPGAPLFYITELYGTILSVLRDGTMTEYASGLLNFNPTGIFPGSGEHGIAGTAVDPLTGDLFVACVYEGVSGAHYPKVIRLHSEDGGRTASTIATILDMADDEIGPSHQISSVSIGPDGRLYVHVGDGFEPEEARYLNSFRGKILRMQLNGQPAIDNPLYNGRRPPKSPSDYIFAYGFRNPFGGAWRQADGSLYEVENGPDVDRLAKVVRGFDYMWSGSNDDMSAGAAYNWFPSVAPVNIAFVQSGTFGGSGFPSGKNDHAFVTESGPTYVSGTTPNGKRIREFELDFAGNVVSTHPFVEYAGTGSATAAALAAGPDGLYFSDLYPDQGSPIARGANVYRIRYVGSVTIGADLAANPPRTVKFSSIVTVPSATNLKWDFGDGSSSTDANPVHTYAGNGPWDVRVSVADAGSGIVDDFTRVVFPEVPGAGLAATYSEAGGTQFRRVDPDVNFDWQADPPPMQSDSFDVTWAGELTPVFSGLYTFELSANGNAQLLIDTQVVIDKSSGAQDASGSPIRLEAGRHYQFVLKSWENDASGVTRLLWSTNGMPAVIVPSTVLYPAFPRRRAAVH